MATDVAKALRECDPVALGARVRERRLALGLTQGEVAGGDMSIAYVSRIEAGNRRPDLVMLEGIAARLDTTSERLLSGVSGARVDELRLAIRYAELALSAGEASDAERSSAVLLTDHEAAAYPDIALDAAYVHAAALESQGRLEEAAAELEKVRLSSELSNRWVMAMSALSRCYREAGNLNRAIDIGEEGIARLKDSGLDGLDDVVRLILTVASAYYERGDEIYAINLCRDALARADETGTLESRASAYWNTSVMMSNRGQVSSAITMAEKALALLGEQEDAKNIARLRAQLGFMMLKTSDSDVKVASELIATARQELGNGIGTVVDIARCDINLARAYVAQGDGLSAERLAHSALDAIGTTSPFVAAEAHLMLGAAAELAGDREQTRTSYFAAAAALSAAGADRAAAQIWYELGALLDKAGEADAARDAYRSAAAATGLRVQTVVGSATNLV